jgi:hypothetical protein
MFNVLTKKSPPKYVSPALNSPQSKLKSVKPPKEGLSDGETEGPGEQSGIS